MRTVLRPAAGPRDRDEAWRETISRTFGGLDVRLGEGTHDRDRLVMGDLGPLRVLESRTGPGESAKRRAGGPEERFALYVQGGGETVAEQKGRSDHYTDGDLGLVDLSQPFRCRYTDRRVVMVTYPSALSPFGRDETNRLLGSRIPAVGALGLLAGLVRHLPRHLEDTDEVEGGRLVSAVLDLMHAGLAPRLGRAAAVGPEQRRHALLLQCRAFIEQHLADPGLSPATVAAAHHVSLRHLHQVFEGTGDTVAGLVRRRRLERCRNDLLDAALATRPVAAIGARWGFTEPANFSRAFKRAFGVPPATFRADLAPAATRP